MAISKRHIKETLFFDFDGNITALKGGKVVSSAIYKNLYQPRKEGWSYAVAEFLPHSDILELMREEAFPAEWKITIGAQKFLLEKLSQADTQLIIISKNRAEYIRAVLALAEIDITQEEASNKLIIKDINSLGSAGDNFSKKKIAEEVLDGLIKEGCDPSKIVVTDDENAECINMTMGAANSLFKAFGNQYRDSRHFLVCSEEAGGLDWNNIQTQISDTTSSIYANKEGNFREAIEYALEDPKTVAETQEQRSAQALNQRGSFANGRNNNATKQNKACIPGCIAM